MTDYLNDIYPEGGNEAASQEESLQKQAQLHVFAELAAENDIDLSKLSSAQVGQLWEEVMGKEASDDGDEGDEDGDSDPKEGKKPLPPFMKKKDDEEKEASALEAAALEEHAEKVAFARKEAESAHMGEVMAHSFVSKVAELEAALNGEASEEAPEEPAKVASSLEGVSAFDILAARTAVQMAQETGFDGEKVAHRVNAVLVLGAPESVKTAGIQDPGAAMQTRALELLESAGLPVQWDEA